MVEVGPERALLHGLAQVAVAGGDHTRARHAARGLADALVLAVLQHAQQLGLQLERQLADLVEEQRAVARVLEIARARGRGAGESALGVAEQRRLDQRRRDCRAVEREVGLVRACRQAVQAARHQFLAAAGLAFDQHRERRVGELRELALQLHQRGALADEFLGAGRAVLFRAQFGVTHCQRARKDLLQCRGIAGFGDEFGRAQRARMARVRSIVLAREHEDAHAGRMREQVGDQQEALVGRMRRRRQSQIDQRQLRRLRQLAQQVDGVLPGFAHQHLEIGAERERQRIGDERVVIDDQQPRPALRRGLQGRRHRYVCISGTRARDRFRRSARAAPRARRESAAARHPAPRSSSTAARRPAARAR